MLKNFGYAYVQTIKLKLQNRPISEYCLIDNNKLPVWCKMQNIFLISVPVVHYEGK